MTEYEYIQRETVKEWVEQWLVQDRYYHPYAKKMTIPVSELYDILSRLPAADVRPVKRGEWKETMEPMGWTEEACAECSVCGETFVLDEYAIEDIQREFKFCPRCGADMRSVTDDGQ